MRLLAHYGLANWPFGDLEPHSFDFIMSDPPWLFGNWSEAGEGRNATSHYRCMPLGWIEALPILDLAAPDTVLWLWGTNPMIHVQIATAQKWGFEFKTMGAWGKLSKNSRLNEDGTIPDGAKLAFGTGYIFRSASEPVIIGTRGTPKFESKRIRSLFLAPVGAHSEKPDLAYEIAEEMMPKAKRLELFSRTNRSGWESWGDQVGLLGSDKKRIAPETMPIMEHHITAVSPPQFQMFGECS